MATNPTESPLSPAQIKALEKALYECNVNLLRIQRAESAGINVDEEKLRCEHQKQRIEAIIAEYRK